MWGNVRVLEADIQIVVYGSLGEDRQSKKGTILEATCRLFGRGEGAESIDTRNTDLRCWWRLNLRGWQPTTAVIPA